MFFNHKQFFTTSLMNKVKDRIMDIKGMTLAIHIKSLKLRTKVYGDTWSITKKLKTFDWKRVQR